jgi:hypothetical protein
MTRPLSLRQKEARVRAILAHPFTATHAAVAAATGFDREIVRRIRVGARYADLLPELERMEPERLDARCHQCVQWEPCKVKVSGERLGRCTLGIPECRSDGQTWARGCGAFSRRS